MVLLKVFAACLLFAGAAHSELQAYLQNPTTAFIAGLPLFGSPSQSQSRPQYQTQSQFSDGFRLKKQPNIVFFLADDLGYADLGYTGNGQVYTPNIDRFAKDGIILNRVYSQATCTPSRAALMTGKHVFRYGLQDMPIDPGQPFGLNLNEKIMSQHFRDLGYEFHGVGKWHLGDYSRKAYPTQRGFNSWFGYMGLGSHYYNYSLLNLQNKKSGLDLRANEWLVRNITGQFIGDLISEQAARTLTNIDRNKPFFMYFSSPFPHVSFNGQGDSLQTTYKYWNHPAVQAIPEKAYTRRRHIANLIAMDMQFRDLVEQLQWKGVLDNTIIVFQSDNGGDTIFDNQPGSNWPLRGAKTSTYEGGSRVLSFVWSPLFNSITRRTQSDMLIHVTDWLPTLYEAAGGDMRNMRGIDGVSQWQALNAQSMNGNRDEVLLSVHKFRGKPVYGVIQRDGSKLYKYIEGQMVAPWKKEGIFQGWDIVAGANRSYTASSKSKPFIKCLGAEGKEMTPCDSVNEPCLFELVSDPCEQDNLAKKDQRRVANMRKTVENYLAQAMPPVNQKFDPKADPALYGNAWVPWTDENPVDPPGSPWMESNAPFDESVAAKLEL